MKEKIDEAAKKSGYKSRRSFILACIAEKYEKIIGQPLEITTPHNDELHTQNE